MTTDLDDYTQSVESVAAVERRRARPLGTSERRELFARWMELNCDAAREMELAAIGIDAAGMRVSAKYLIERQRYEGSARLTGVPFTDSNGVERVYAINNSDSALLARWLHARNPEMDIELRASMYDEGA